MPRILSPDPDTDLAVQVPVDGEQNDATPSFQHAQALLNKIARLEREVAELEQENSDALRDERTERRYRDEDLTNRRVISGFLNRPTFDAPADYHFLGRVPLFAPPETEMRLTELSFWIPGNDGVQLDLELQLKDANTQRLFIDTQFSVQRPNLVIGTADSGGDTAEIAIALRRDTPFDQTTSGVAYLIVIDFIENRLGY